MKGGFKMVEKNQELIENENYLQFSSGGDLNDCINKHWKIRLIKSKNKRTGRTNYFIELTSTLGYDKIIFPKHEFENPDLVKRNLNKMREIGVAERRYIKAISNYVNDALYDNKDKIIELEGDASLFYDINREFGLNVIGQYKAIIAHIENNKDLYPTKSSNKFNDESSEGAILDNIESKNGEHPIAIRAEILKMLIGGSSNEYRKILEVFLLKGLIKGNLDNLELKLVEKRLTKKDKDGNMIEMTKEVYEKPRLSKNIAVRNGKEISGFQINIIPAYLEGGK